MIQSTPILKVIPTDSVVVTLHMDDQSSQYFTALRETYFPADRNYLPAHVTLFHKLPGQELERLCQDAYECAKGHAELQVNVTGVRFLGRGVAYKVESAGLSSLRSCLAKRWQAFLGAQDKQRFQPHITVQNKVTPECARKLAEELAASFARREIRGQGLDFWFYRGGPWQFAASVLFQADLPGHISRADGINGL